MKNLVGCKFGEWSVIREGQRKGGKRYWFCECICGTAIQARRKRGLTKEALIDGLRKV